MAHGDASVPLRVHTDSGKIRWESPESMFYRAIIRLVFGVGG